MVRRIAQVRLLVDTHILLWWLADDPALPGSARAALTSGRNDPLVSAISIAEISIKSSLGKLTAPANIWSASLDAGFEGLPFTGAHQAELANLPWHHRDPFDRMLIAQARVEGVNLVTVNSRFADYEVGLLTS